MDYFNAKIKSHKHFHETIAIKNFTELKRILNNVESINDLQINWLSIKKYADNLIEHVQNYTAFDLVCHEYDKNDTF